MTSLRILFVTRSLPFHGLGGMETVAWDLARAFKSLGHHVSVMTTACAALSPKSVVEGIAIYTLDVPSGRYSGAWWHESRRFYTETLKGKIDIVLSVSAGAMRMAAARDASDPARYFVQAHGTAWGEIVSKLGTLSIKNWVKALLTLKPLIADRGYRRFDAMITVGPRVTSDAARWPTRAILGALPIHEIRNGIDTNVFHFDAAQRADIRQRYGIAATAPVALSLSRLHIQKGVQHSLEGFKRALAINPNWRFLIVGSGPHTDTLKQLAASLELGDAVIFTGAIARDAAPGFYSAADAFLFTSTRIEGLPLNVLEALACGLPVVVSNHIALAGQPHQYPVDPLKYDEIATALAASLTDSRDEPRSCLLNRDYWLATSVDQYLSLFAA